MTCNSNFEVVLLPGTNHQSVTFDSASELWQVNGLKDVNVRPMVMSTKCGRSIKVLYRDSKHDSMDFQWVELGSKADAMKVQFDGEHIRLMDEPNYAILGCGDKVYEDNVLHIFWHIYGKACSFVKNEDNTISPNVNKELFVG